MKIQITMVSGKKYLLTASKYKVLNDWIKNTFSGGAAWFKISPECDFVIRIDNIEEIEATA